MGRPSNKQKEHELLTQTRVVAIYFVRTLGQPTLGEIISASMEKLKFPMTEILAERALTAAQKMDFVAINQKADDKEQGRTVKVYSLRNIAWKSPPQVKDIKQLVAAVLQDPDLQKIQDWFSAKDAEPDGEGKENVKGNLICDYHAFEVKLITLTPIVGAQIKCEYSNAISKKFDDPDIKVDGIFQRNELTGQYLLPSDLIQNWWINNAGRYLNMAESKAQYIGAADCLFTPHTNPVQYVLPVNNSRSGASAPKAYECIPAGQELTFRFVMPTKGFLPAEMIELGTALAIIRPRRGFSPARGRRFGKGVPLDWKDLGPLEGLGLSHLVKDVPEEVLKKHGVYLLSAEKRLRNAKLSPSMRAYMLEDFPSFEGGDDDSDETPASA